MLTLLTAILVWHWITLFYAWPLGLVWGNVLVIAVLAPLGWLWSKTKFWPLNYLERRMEHLHDKVDALHDKHDAHSARLDEISKSVDALHEKLSQRSE